MSYINSNSSGKKYAHNCKVGANNIYGLCELEDNIEINNNKDISVWDSVYFIKVPEEIKGTEQEQGVQVAIDNKQEFVVIKIQDDGKLQLVNYENDIGLYDVKKENIKKF